MWLTGSNILVRPLKHYLIGFDRPTLGQVQTLWPTEELADVPGGNSQLKSFTNRLILDSKSYPIGSAIYRVEPWGPLVLAGRLEKTYDSTLPKREVDHIHTVLLDPVSKPSRSLIPTDLLEMFITARSFLTFSALGNEFYREISVRLRLDAQLGTEPSTIPKVDLQPSALKNTVDRLNQHQNTNQLNEITDLLLGLPESFANRMHWGFVTNKKKNRTTHQSETVPLLKHQDDYRRLNNYEVQTSANQLACLIFDLVFPIVTIDKAFELATRHHSKNDLSGLFESDFKSIVDELVDFGFKADRLAIAICENSVISSRNRADDWSSLARKLFIELFSESWEEQVSRLGYPRLSKLLSNTPTGTEPARLSKSHKSLIKTATIDREYKAFTTQLGPKTEFGSVIDFFETTDTLVVEHVTPLCDLYNSNTMAEMIRNSILQTEDTNNLTWKMIQVITVVLKKELEPTLIEWWFDVIQSATSTRRSLFQIIGRRNNEFEHLISKYHDVHTVKYIKATVEAFESDQKHQAPPNLEKLLDVITDCA